MPDRNELLRRKITGLDEAKAWIADLVAIGLMFHFEDSADTIINGLTGERLFDDEEAVLVRARMAELYALDWPAEFECPIGYMMHVEERDR